jgi:hypothetical protein
MAEAINRTAKLIAAPPQVMAYLSLSLHGCRAQGPIAGGDIGGCGEVAEREDHESRVHEGQVLGQSAVKRRNVIQTSGV